MRQLTLLIIGLIGAALFSQAPEFLQQYRQNLDGRVAELTTASTAFERGGDSAVVLDSLAQAGGVSADIAASGRALLERRDRLAAHEEALDGAGPFLRLVEFARGYDAEVADATLAKYEPAVPVTLEGAAHAGAGFFLFRFVGVLLLGGLGVFSGRRREA